MPTLHTLHRRLDAALTQFKALDLGSKPGGCCPEPYDPKQPYYPTIYVSDRAEAEVLDVAEEGTAVVKYRVKGRSMNERNGKKRYGMDLEIRSFDPEASAKADAKKKKEGEAVKLSSQCAVHGSRLHEFAHTPVGKPWPAGTSKFSEFGSMGLKRLDRVAQALDGTRKRVVKYAPWDAHGKGGLRSVVAKKAFHKTEQSGIRDGVKWDADGRRKLNNEQRAKMKKSEFSSQSLNVSKSQSLHHFSSRPRDGDGQFVANVTGGADPVTMRQAYGEKKQSNLLLPGAAAGALAGAGLLAGTGKGRALVASGLRKVEGLARTGRDKLQGRQRMSQPGRGPRPGFGEVLMRDGKPEGKPKLPGAMTRYHAILDEALTEFGKPFTASIMHPSSLPKEELKYAKDFMRRGSMALVEREGGKQAGLALAKSGGKRMFKRWKREWLRNNPPEGK